jgi:hypothetical protein
MENQVKEKVTVEIRGIKFVGYLTEAEQKKAEEAVKFINEHFRIYKD